jgi:hypothetical protein
MSEKRAFAVVRNPAADDMLTLDKLYAMVRS